MKITDSELARLRLNPNQNKDTVDIKLDISKVRSGKFTITKAVTDSEAKAIGLDLKELEKKIKREVSLWK